MVAAALSFRVCGEGDEEALLRIRICGGGFSWDTGFFVDRRSSFAGAVDAMSCNLILQLKYRGSHQVVDWVRLGLGTFHCLPNYDFGQVG